MRDQVLEHLKRPPKRHQRQPFIDDLVLTIW
jgi:hypothetical protein